eukprot:TRINITY_DN4154_c0_g1_i1.p1 TRINITY_DN4154_c0_g1~~TRINITY_DN4154_c0_g1_i1.p1  ORF type:complete len:750 (+),score=206.41 TRINITY_DN4154_c0_g1_i1:439-2688(+)
MSEGYIALRNGSRERTFGEWRANKTVSGLDEPERGASTGKAAKVERTPTVTTAKMEKISNDLRKIIGKAPKESGQSRAPVSKAANMTKGDISRELDISGTQIGIKKPNGKTKDAGRATTKAGMTKSKVGEGPQHTTERKKEETNKFSKTSSFRNIPVTKRTGDLTLSRVIPKGGESDTGRGTDESWIVKSPVRNVSKPKLNIGQLRTPKTKLPTDHFQTPLTDDRHEKDKSLMIQGLAKRSESATKRGNLERAVTPGSKSLVRASPVKKELKQKQDDSIENSYMNRRADTEEAKDDLRGHNSSPSRERRLLESSQDQTRSDENLLSHPEPPENKIKNKLNLEIVIDLEEIIQNLQNDLRSGTPIHGTCLEYLEHIQREDFEGIDRLFRDGRLRKEIRFGVILEKISVVLFLYCYLERKVTSDLAPHIRNISHCIHQNFLILLELIFERISSPSTQNSWYFRLKELLEMKKVTKFNKNEAAIHMKTNNDTIISLIRNNFSKENKEIINEILFMLKNIDKIQVGHSQTLLLQALENYKAARKDIDKEDLKASHLERLPTVQAPYLPALSPGKAKTTFTLVLDLDETLVHYEECGQGGKFLIRPYTMEFLREMYEYYEIVVFTAAMQDYADWVLNNLDTNNYISYRLYRQHAIPNGTGYIKDLSKLGRDMSHTIIVDNVPENFQLQSDNGIFIRSWFNDPHDTALMELAPLLREIAGKKVLDVRDALRKFRDQMIENINRGVQQPHLHLSLD